MITLNFNIISNRFDNIYGQCVHNVNLIELYLKNTIQVGQVGY